jgi:hypothetical protein
MKCKYGHEKIHNNYCNICKQRSYAKHYISIRKTQKQEEFEFTINYVYEYTEKYLQELKNRRLLAEFKGNYYRNISLQYAKGEIK